MKHVCNIRMESRRGMQQVEYRVTCTCGYQDKALDKQTAQVVIERHLRRPNR